MAFLEFKGDFRVKLDGLAGDPELAAKEFLERLRAELFKDIADLKMIQRIRKSGATVVRIDFAIGPE